MDSHATATPGAFCWLDLAASDSAAAKAFYARAFGATELYRLQDPSGTIGHAEMQVGDSHFMLADECPEMGALAPAPESPAGSATPRRTLRALPA